MTSTIVVCSGAVLETMVQVSSIDVKDVGSFKHRFVVVCRTHSQAQLATLWNVHTMQVDIFEDLATEIHERRRVPHCFIEGTVKHSRIATHHIKLRGMSEQIHPHIPNCLVSRFTPSCEQQLDERGQLFHLGSDEARKNVVAGHEATIGNNRVDVFVQRAVCLTATLAHDGVIP